MLIDRIIQELNFIAEGIEKGLVINDAVTQQKYAALMKRYSELTGSDVAIDDAGLAGGAGIT